MDTPAKIQYIVHKINIVEKQGVMMEQVTRIISENLKKIRKERDLTLQSLADLTGVSKSMLGEIERGATNPTITVLWKIAKGLKMPFSRLITQGREPVMLVKREQMEPVVEGSGYDVFSLFQFDEDTKFEVFMEEIQPGARYTAEVHTGNVEEHVLVGQGKLKLTLGDEEYLLLEGEAMKFTGERSHAYENPGNQVARIFFILHYGDMI